MYSPVCVCVRAGWCGVQVSYEKVRVLFPFHSQKDDELELIRGDVIYVMGKGTDGWAYGKPFCPHMFNAHHTCHCSYNDWSPTVHARSFAGGLRAVPLVVCSVPSVTDLAVGVSPRMDRRSPLDNVV